MLEPSVMYVLMLLIVELVPPPVVAAWSYRVQIREVSAYMSEAGCTAAAMRYLAELPSTARGFARCDPRDVGGSPPPIPEQPPCSGQICPPPYTR